MRRLFEKQEKFTQDYSNIIAIVIIKNKYKAFDFEKYLKSGSGRAFIKKHLI